MGLSKFFFGTCSLAVLLVGTTFAGESVDPKKKVQELNVLTGSVPMALSLKDLLKNPTNTKSVLQTALPMVKDGKISYNGAFVLGLAAADLKDMKTSEVFFRFCMEKAAKLQSVQRLVQSYGGLIDLYYDQRQYEDSARICKELLDLKTDDGKQRIVLRAMKGRFGEIDFFEDDNYNTTNNLRPTVQQQLVKAIAKQGKYEQAIKLVDSMLKDQDHWMERQLKGWVLREAGKPEEASKIYEEVIKKISADRQMDREEREYYADRYRYELSNIYVDMKQIERATEQLQILIKRNPNEPGYHNDLGYIWADHDQKLEEAEELIKKALDLDRERRKKSPNFDPATDKDNGAYLDSLGWVLYKKKQYKEAKDWLVKALEDKNSQHIEIYDHLGDAYMALGDREQAIQAWQKGVDVANETVREQARKKVVQAKVEKAKAQK